MSNDANYHELKNRVRNQRLLNVLHEIHRDHPYLPRADMSDREIGITFSGTENWTPSLEQWEKFKVLIASYVFLRIRGFQKQAVYVYVFRQRAAYDVEVLRDLSYHSYNMTKQIEESAEYQIEFTKQLGAMGIERLLNGVKEDAERCIRESQNAKLRNASADLVHTITRIQRGELKRRED